MAAGKGGGHAGNSGQLRQVMGCSFEVKKEIRHGEWTKLLIFKWLTMLCEFHLSFLKTQCRSPKDLRFGGGFSLSVLGNLKPHVLGIAIFISSQCLSQPPDLFCSES